MKRFLSMILALGIFLSLTSPSAYAGPVGRSRYSKVVYINAAMTSTQSAAYSGADYTTAKGFYDSAALFTIPGGCVVEQMYVVVDTIVSGITLFRLGDSNDAAGFISSASSPLASAGLLYYDLTSKGAYLKINSSIQAKYFSADTAVALDVTGTATAGKIRVAAEGYCL